MAQTEDGRRVFIWNGADDAGRLIDLIAETTAGELFNLDGETLSIILKGKAVRVTKDVLRALIAKRIASVRPVCRAGVWETETYAFEFQPGERNGPNEQFLLDLITKKDGLISRVARAPLPPSRLTERQVDEIRMRSKTGEPKDRLAEIFKVDVDTIRYLTQY